MNPHGPKTWWAQRFGISVGLGCLCIATGLPLSRSLITCGIGILAIAIALHGNPLLLIRQSWRTALGRGLWVVYALYLVSYFYSTDLAQWQYLVWTKLPMLIVPLALLPQRVAIGYRSVVLLLYVAGVSLISLLTVWQYATDYATYHALLLQSKAIPVVGGMLHLSFGLMQAGAIVVCGYMGMQQRQRRYGWWGLGVFLFIAVHVLSSRTGLLCSYVGLLVLLVYVSRIWPARAQRLAFGAVLLLPLCALLLPTVRHKLANSWQDLAYYQAGRHLDDWSLGRRLAAWETAWQVGAAAPLAGVAPADVRPEMERQYAQAQYNMSPAARAASHNQYLEIFAGLGLLGLLVHGWWAWRCVRSQHPRNPVWLSHLAILCAAMLTDNLLDYQLGLCWAVFFTCLLWQPDDAVAA